MIRLRDGVTVTDAELAELAVFMPLLNARLDELAGESDPLEVAS